MKAIEQFFSVMLIIKLYKVVLSFKIADKISKSWPFKEKLIRDPFMLNCLFFQDFSIIELGH